MTDHRHVIFDDTAMVAVGRGSQIASRLIHRAHAAEGLSIYATACAVVEAERTRPGRSGGSTSSFVKALLIYYRR